MNKWVKCGECGATRKVKETGSQVVCPHIVLLDYEPVKKKRSPESMGTQIKIKVDSKLLQALLDNLTEEELEYGNLTDWTNEIEDFLNNVRKLNPSLMFILVKPGDTKKIKEVKKGA